jgi:hypothetical protein
VPDQDVLDRRRGVDRVDQADVLLARDAEHMADAFGFQAAHQQVGYVLRGCDLIIRAHGPEGKQSARSRASV